VPSLFPNLFTDNLPGALASGAVTKRNAQAAMNPGQTSNTFQPGSESPAQQVLANYAALVKRKAPNATPKQIARAYFMDKDKGLVD